MKDPHKIETLDRYGNWSDEPIGDNNCFDSEADAIEAIESLCALGGEWAYDDNGNEQQYRVVPV